MISFVSKKNSVYPLRLLFLDLRITKSVLKIFCFDQLLSTFFLLGVFGVFALILHFLYSFGNCALMVVNVETFSPTLQAIRANLVGSLFPFVFFQLPGVPLTINVPTRALGLKQESFLFYEFDLQTLLTMKMVFVLVESSKNLPSSFFCYNIEPSSMCLLLEVHEVLPRVY